jgi:hypothetical protein
MSALRTFQSNAKHILEQARGKATVKQSLTVQNITIRAATTEETSVAQRADEDDEIDLGATLAESKK